MPPPHSFAVPRRSFFGGEYHQENARMLADFLFEHAKDRHIEIEGKLGIVLRNDTDERLDWPLLSQCILGEDRIFRFQSSISEEQFLQLRGKLEHHPEAECRHLMLVDKIYPKRVRVTVDEDCNTELCLKKLKLASLNFFEPSCAIDFRITASSEDAVDFPVCRPDYERRKDRRSYKFKSHPLFQFDVSRVATTVRTPPEISYEFEVEITDMPFLIEERAKAVQGQPNQLLAIAQGLLNCMSALCHAVPGPNATPGAPISDGSSIAAAGKVNSSERNSNSDAVAAASSSAPPAKRAKT